MRQSSAKSPLWFKVLGAISLVLVLGIGFLGYLTPSMRLNWDAIVTMCGF